MRGNTLSPNTTKRFQPNGEILEERSLMAAGTTVNVVGNVLMIQGTEAADLIQVTYRAFPPNPRWGGLGTGMAIITLDGTQKLRAFRFQGIVIHGGGGDDGIAMTRIGANSLPIGINAGAGNDVVIGTTGDEVLFGNDGNDTILGLGGFDNLIGGEGIDTINGITEAPPPPLAQVVIPPSRPTPPPTIPSWPPTTPVVTSPSTTDQDLAPLADQVVVYTNAERQKGGLAVVTVNPKLSRMAQLHAEAMARVDRMEHTLNGAALPDLQSRANYVGYSFSLLGENIAFNFRDASSLTYAWMSSPGHRQNLMNPDFVEIGVGVARNSRGELYYCEVLGRPS